MPMHVLPLSLAGRTLSSLLIMILSQRREGGQPALSPDSVMEAGKQLSTQGLSVVLL